MDRNEVLQVLCRMYLQRLRYMAKKHGLLDFVDNTIAMNKEKKCHATQHEVEMLSRVCDDERVYRVDIPSIIGKTYRECNEDGDFDKIKKLPRVGLYSKVDALLYNKK